MCFFKFKLLFNFFFAAEFSLVAPFHFPLCVTDKHGVELIYDLICLNVQVNTYTGTNCNCSLFTGKQEETPWKLLYKFLIENINFPQRLCLAERYWVKGRKRKKENIKKTLVNMG